ncbi:hypothetical protein CLU79DRAFT_780629 [Phycomyces nitens]|nr:hypothetical protein CLU79DRAFT_780629 [Phycomyces nitens]
MPKPSFPIWAAILVAMFSFLFTFSIAYIVIRKYLGRPGAVGADTSFEKQVSMESSELNIARNIRSNDSHAEQYRTNITLCSSVLSPTLNTSGSFHEIHPKSSSIVRVEEEPAAVIVAVEPQIEKPKDSKITLPFPPPATSFFSDKMELSSDEANDLFEKYSMPTPLSPTDPEQDYVAITVEDKQQPLFYSTFQQKTATLRSTLRQSLRRKKSTKASSIPVSQLFDASTKKEIAPPRQSRLPRPSTAKSIQSSGESMYDNQTQADSHSLIIGSPEACTLLSETSIFNLPTVPYYSPSSSSISDGFNISVPDWSAEGTGGSGLHPLQFPQEAVPESAPTQCVIRPPTRKVKPHSIVTNRDVLYAAVHTTPTETSNYTAPLPQPIYNGSEMDYFSVRSRTTHALDSIPITPGSAHRLVRDSIVADDRHSAAASAAKHRGSLGSHAPDSGPFHSQDFGYSSAASVSSHSSSSSGESVKGDLGFVSPPLGRRYIHSGSATLSGRLSAFQAETKIPPPIAVPCRRLSKRATLGRTSQIPTTAHTSVQGVRSLKAIFDTVEQESQKIELSPSESYAQMTTPHQTPASGQTKLANGSHSITPRNSNEPDSSTLVSRNTPIRGNNCPETSNTATPFGSLSPGTAARPVSNVDTIRRMLQATWNASNVKESGSLSSLNSSDTGSTFRPGFSPVGSINPRLQNQHLVSLSLRGHQHLQQQQAKRRPLMPMGFMDDDTAEGPTPTVSFSSSTVQTMIPANEDPATKITEKKKQIVQPSVVKKFEEIKTGGLVLAERTRIQETAKAAVVNAGSAIKPSDDGARSQRRQPRGSAPWTTPTAITNTIVNSNPNKTPAQIERDKYLGSKN